MAADLDLGKTCSVLAMAALATFLRRTIEVIYVSRAVLTNGGHAGVSIAREDQHSNLPLRTHRRIRSQLIVMSDEV